MQGEVLGPLAIRILRSSSETVIQSGLRARILGDWLKWYTQPSAQIPLSFVFVLRLCLRSQRHLPRRRVGSRYARSDGERAPHFITEQVRFADSLTCRLALTRSASTTPPRPPPQIREPGECASRDRHRRHNCFAAQLLHLLQRLRHIVRLDVEVRELMPKYAPNRGENVLGTDAGDHKWEFDWNNERLFRGQPEVWAAISSE